MYRISISLIFILFILISFSQTLSPPPSNDFFKIEVAKILDGEYIDSIEKIKWRPYPQEVISKSKDGMVYTSIDSIISFKINSESYKLIILRSIEVLRGIEDQSASNSPTLGLALFIEKASGFELVKINRSIDRIGQAGLLPLYSIINISPSEKAFMITEENFQETTVYCHIYFLSEWCFSRIALEFPVFSLIDFHNYKYHTNQIEVLDKSIGFDGYYNFQINTKTFTEDKLIDSKLNVFKFNGRKWEGY
jgi:hypothetical protein